MNKVYLSLGSNQGERLLWLEQAMHMLEDQAGKIITRSPVYVSKAWGLEAQPDFLNMALLLDTAKDPRQLLHIIRTIEEALGRQRHIKWGPRTLDIDILFFNDDVIASPELTVPHPFIQDRAFVLTPMADIAPGFIHPVLHKTIAALLTECTDLLAVTPL